MASPEIVVVRGGAQPDFAGEAEISVKNM